MEMKTRAGREKLPIKVFRPFVSVGLTTPDFPATYLYTRLKKKREVNCEHHG